MNSKHAAWLWNMWKCNGVNLGGVREGDQWANCDVYLDVTCTAWAHYTSLALCPPQRQHPRAFLPERLRPWKKSQAYRSTLLTCYGEMLIFQTTRSKRTKCAANTRRVPSHLNGNLPLGGGWRCVRSWIIRLAKSVGMWSFTREADESDAVTSVRASCHPQITPSNWPRRRVLPENFPR